MTEDSKGRKVTVVRCIYVYVYCPSKQQRQIVDSNHDHGDRGCMKEKEKEGWGASGDIYAP